MKWVSIRPYTNKEWDKLSHVILTADVDWDPSILDHELEDGEEWFDTMQDIPEFDPDPLFDEVGDYKPTLESYNRNLIPSDVDYNLYHSKLAWLPTGWPTTCLD